MSTDAGGQSRRPGRSGRLRLLLISNMWPSERDPVFGVFVSRHVRALRDAGISVRVVANRDSRTGLFRAPLKYASLLVRAVVSTVLGSHDLVVGHFLYPTAAIAAATARVGHLPFAVVAHGTDVRSLERDSRIAAAGRAAVSTADLRVAVSGALADKLRVIAGLGADAPVSVIHMGIDTAVFRPDVRARERLGLPANERVVLFAGKLVPVKGVEVLLRAFAALSERGGADRLVIVGDGSLASELRETASALGIADRAHFAGQLEQGELANWMAAADVFALPSRDEGRGLVLLEAMACGTPCVASAVGGVPETLPERCGRLVVAGDPDALADAMSAVLAAGKRAYSTACIEYARTQDVNGQAERFIVEIERVVSA